MEKQTLTFTLERETKNTIRYAGTLMVSLRLSGLCMFRSGYRGISIPRS
jgi:hypothetical protein